MPVLALGYARFADVDRELPVVGSLQEFGETATIIAIHLQIKGNLAFGKIGYIHRI